jgi:hypothetical protein
MEEYDRKTGSISTKAQNQDDFLNDNDLCDEDESSPFVLQQQQTDSNCLAVAIKNRNSSISSITKDIMDSCKKIPSTPSESGDSEEEISKTNKNFMKRLCSKFSQRQVVFLTLFAFVDLLAATIISIQAPFYPEVVSGKKHYVFMKRVNYPHDCHSVEF